MADKPISTTFIFVDRRNTGRGKSVNNRQKLLKRIKDSIRQSKPSDIAVGGVADAGKGGASNNQVNPIRVARNALAEPVFHYTPNMGEREIILVGNDRWLKGDQFPLNGQSEGDGEGEAGHGEDTEDDYIVNVSKNEFFDVFFEDCELPNMQENHEKDTPEATWQRAGYQKSGNAGQLSVIRSFKQSKMRRIALTSTNKKLIEELEEELNNTTDKDKIAELEAQIIKFKIKNNAISLFENVDLRYRKQEKVQVKTSDAAFFMLMDVSGSMDEEKKLIARRLFALQYAFIKRVYPNIDIIFIAHTDEAQELEEDEFFTTKLSGGTTVSSAFKLMHEIIKERYDANITNIYASYAGDGDNWVDDNAVLMAEIEDSGLLLKLRHAVYSQIKEGFISSYGGQNNLWNTMQSISKSTKKVSVIKIASEDEIFDAFKTIYKRKA